MILGSISHFFLIFWIFFSVLAVLGPEMGPDRPDLPRYFVSAWNFPVATHPEPFRGQNIRKPVGPGRPGSGPGLDQGLGPGLAQGQAQGLAQGQAQGLAQGLGPGLGPGSWSGPGPGSGPRPNHLS